MRLRQLAHLALEVAELRTPFDERREQPRVGGRVVRYQRFDELREALAYVRLTDDDEVLPLTG